MAPNMNVQSNASEKVFVLAVLIMVVHLAVGMRGPANSDRDGDGDDDGDVFALRSDCPPFGHRRGPIPLRWHQTCHSGTKRTERTTKESTGVSSPTLLCTVKCVRFLERERNMNQKTELPIKRAPPFP